MQTTKLNNKTRKAEHYIKEYKNSFCYSVFDFYTRCSSRKVGIENEIKERINKNGFIGYKVLFGNCFDFTCGYMSRDMKTLYIETKCNIFEIAL